MATAPPAKVEEAVFHQSFAFMTSEPCLDLDYKTYIRAADSISKITKNVTKLNKNVSRKRSVFMMHLVAFDPSVDQTG